MYENNHKSSVSVSCVVTNQICKYSISNDEDQLHRNENPNYKQTKQGAWHGGAGLYFQLKVIQVARVSSWL